MYVFHVTTHIPNSIAARMRTITARFGIKVGSTAVLALGGTAPVRSFHVPTNNQAAGSTTGQPS